MNIRPLLRRLRNAFRRDGQDVVEDELRFHIQMETEAGLRAGLPPAEARARAYRAFGGLDRYAEALRDERRLPWVDALLRDGRYGLRALRRDPAFTVVAVITLGLGIGASTAIFSAVSPILFEPLPYPDAGRLVSIGDRAADDVPVDVTFGTFREVAQRSRSFESLAVVRRWQPTLTGEERPERLTGQRVSARYFRVLGVVPALGRDFDPADDRASGPRVVLLGDGLWRRRFGGDSAVIGRQVRLDDEPFTVIGVLPRGFENVVAPDAQVWTLLAYDAALPSFDGREWGHHLRMVGRLSSGVPLEVVRGELDAIAASPIAGFARPPWADMGRGLVVRPLGDGITQAVRPTLVAVLCAVALLLVIACLNVANLLLARGALRRGEFAVRAVLGAGRGRLVQQLLTEGLLLAVLGGSLGVVAARAGVRVLVALAPPGLPRLEAIRVDGPALAFAAAVTTLVAIAVGLLPAFHVARGDAAALEHASRRTSGRLGIRRGLVVLEISLAMVLLVASALLFRSLQRLFAVEPGFEAAQTLVVQVQASGRRYADDDATHRFFARALDAVRAVPGVASAAVTSQLPLTGEDDVYGVTLEHETDEQADRAAFRYAVSPDYFETLDIPLLAGRRLDARDRAGAPGAVVLGQAFADRLFPGRDAIGQRVHVGRTDLPWYTVVGVVGDVRHASLAAATTHALYVTPEQWYFADPVRWFVVRTHTEPAALVPAVERAIWSVDDDQPIVRTATLESLLADSEAERRFALSIFAAFASLALALAAVGIYGVVAATVHARRHEIGIRTALGATRGGILALVVTQGITLTGLGIALGSIAALAASSTLAALLFEISRFDVPTYVAVALVVALVALAASVVPARRAAGIPPSQALRSD